jgi:pimeloyl-ACP methyl ester carboxylesterase
MQLLFLHGLESGPHGSKYQALAAAFGTVLAPDTTGISDPAHRLARIAKATQDLRSAVIVGSSFGGLMAVLLAEKYPERCHRLVLMAPAVHVPLIDHIQRQPPTVIVHGTRDAVVPFSASETFAARTGALLLPQDDDHRLAASLSVMIEQVRLALDGSS